MKRNIITLFVLVLVSACSNFEEINTDVYGITDAEYKAGGLAYGSAFMAMQQSVIPIGSPNKKTDPGNQLQNTDLISSGNYIGYFGNNNNWNFRIESNWNFEDGRMSYANKNFYSNFFQQWQDINSQASKNMEDPYNHRVMSISNILRVAAWLRATDVFGPIVYTNAGKGDIAPKLDSQEHTYRSMLADLEQSVKILNNTFVSVMKDYDLIYDGDVKKWVKLANSLMLRMAVRSHFKDKALAQEYISKALDPANGGVISNINEEAKIGDSDKFPLLNPMIASVQDYGETKMGTTIWAYLKGYRDPRLDKYFTLGTDSSYDATGYFAVAPANTFPRDDKQGAAEASRPKVTAKDPMYWFRASEVLFLKAEAALYGLTSGSAKEYYEQGVKMSFQENNVSSEADYYLTTNNKPLELTSNPQDANGYKYAGYGPNYQYVTYGYNLGIGNVSPKWDEANSEEEKLQKIITQKYLALYPNAVEAWTEYRRTGYPYVMPPMDQQAPGRIGCQDCFVPERFRYAASAYSNPNMSEVPALLGGEDRGSTKLWWVRDNRPTQQK